MRRWFFLQAIQLSMKKSDSVLWIVANNGQITSVSGQDASNSEEERKLSNARNAGISGSRF